MKNLRIKIYDTTTLLGVSNGFQINMNVSYPKGSKQIEVISEQTAKQYAWAWKKNGETVVKKLHQMIFVIQYFSRNSTGWRNQGKCDGWNTQADKSHKNLVEKPADSGKLGAPNVNWRIIGDNIKIDM